jgi:hypothetical protein
VIPAGDGKWIRTGHVADDDELRVEKVDGLIGCTA